MNGLILQIYGDEHYLIDTTDQIFEWWKVFLWIEITVSDFQTIVQIQFIKMNKTSLWYLFIVIISFWLLFIFLDDFFHYFYLNLLIIWMDHKIEAEVLNLNLKFPNL